jgi:pimeloyl-ACP methyl ester carboxylesterase
MATGLRIRYEGDYFDSNGVWIHYTDEGKGEPLILVHGFAADGNMNWRLPGFIRSFRRRYRVITMDCRGHGFSDKPQKRADYGQQMMEDIVRLMDHLHIEKAHVAGYSMGGFLTMTLCGAHPDRLATATIAGAGYYPPGAYPDLIHTVPDALDEGKGFDPILRYLEPKGARFREFRIFTASMFLSLVHDRNALARCFEALEDLQGTEVQLANNEVPVLSVMGTEDPLRDSLEHMIGITRNHHVHWLHGANHVTAVLNPLYVRNFTRRVKKHLKQFALAEV